MKGKNPFTLRVVEAIRAIPRGNVATYGQIAILAGSLTGARQVSWVLNSCSRSENLPWHRVVNSRGTISLEGEGKIEQRALLEAEGVLFDDEGRIDLVKFLWQPEGQKNPP
jgi:methylated-DNA-protein-cysteine methyltransferase related protein